MNSCRQISDFLPRHGDLRTLSPSVTRPSFAAEQIFLTGIPSMLSCEGQMRDGARAGGRREEAVKPLTCRLSMKKQRHMKLKMIIPVSETELCWRISAHSESP